MASGHDRKSSSFLPGHPDEDTLDPNADRMETAIFRETDAVEREDATTRPLKDLEERLASRGPQHTPGPPLQSPFAPQQTPYPPAQSPFTPQQTPHPPAQSPFAPQQTPFPMANRPPASNTGPFLSATFTPAHNMPAQGAAQPGFNPQPGPGGFGTPGFVKPTTGTIKKDELGTKLRVQFALGAIAAGALVGALMGIINAKVQGWTVLQGSSQLFTLALAMAVVFGIVAYLRPDRIEELLVQYGILDLEETSTLGASPRAPGGSVSQGPFPTPVLGQGDPDGTDEIPSR
ncbi:MAG: hypothetical protein ACNA8W_01125 [Bradymonadaceae bacterium]